MSEVTARLDAAPMGWRRWLAVGLVPVLAILDGYDAASISFAAPAIAKDWQVPSDTLGWLLSMELVGMAIGSVVVGIAADRIGRRPSVIACIVTIMAGMFLAARTGTVDAMLVVRLVTGLGIGGLLAAITALIGEYARLRDRSFAIAIMTMGYPVGGMVGGWIAADILSRTDWTAIFTLGALATAVILPLVLLFMPESPEWIERRRPPRALERINASLTHLGAQPLETLADAKVQESADGLPGIFRGRLLSTTVLLTLAYVFHVGAFYFLAKWLPKLAVEIGFTSSEGALVLSRYMMGSACGGLVLAALSKRFGAKVAILGVLALFSTTMVLFGQFPGEFGRSLPIMVLFGVMANVPAAGFYVLLADAYPPQLRATGIGFGVGVGRAGASLGPVLAGYLFAQGASLSAVAISMACSSICAALAIWALRQLSASSACSPA